MNSEESALPQVLITDRRGKDRRRDKETDRRKRSIPVAVERRSGTERRERGERRRQVDPPTCERDYNDDEIIFMKAVDKNKRDNPPPLPTWGEGLEGLRALGYRKGEAAPVLPGLPGQGW